MSDGRLEEVGCYPTDGARVYLRGDAETARRSAVLM